MLTFPKINPIALSIGPLDIYWYGIMYLIGFLLASWALMSHKRWRGLWTYEEILDLGFYVALGVIFGGRLGFILFYAPDTLMTDPVAIVRFWERGRSFHGGLLGVLIAVWYYAKRHNRKPFAVFDMLAPVVPYGLAAGRLGNFINGELWGRVTDVPWAMVFPHAGPWPRHPSQLYEFLLEGVVLGVALTLYARKQREPGKISGWFLVGYGLLRCLVELFREPDKEAGFLFASLTMGQALSLPMILLGIWLLWPKKRVLRR